MTGLFLINKPAGMTSHDVVDEIRALTNERRVGHAGTLDPFAVGLLIVLVGREATKKQILFLNLDKTYKATIRLGETSTTHDPEGEIQTTQTEIIDVTRKTMETVLKKFTGKYEQMPPQFSAKKVRGKKAYELARQGKTVSLTPKEITIYSLNLSSYDWPFAEIETTVSSGTYIRALARDIGKDLKIGAYLTSLQRTQIGPFKLENAIELKNLSKEHILSLEDTMALLDKNEAL